ncbi:MAG TPA: hypothetical protein VKA94_09145 [Hyphomicrobiales bacterium]|nr:hypothetical protein [Hyphomicrobiales bacterium]
MSYRERMEELTAKIRDCFDENPEVAKVAFINYSPQLIDMGDVADKLSADVERLSASKENGNRDDLPIWT